MPIIICCLILFFSPELLAQTVPSVNAMTFAPPISDSSMMYLANIFGTVDGVLVSTGSQMLGKMMAVFNMAILALGSVVIMYALVIGTLNTAHEGEFLGKHWSSIWLPVRCCTGLALLVPKASGYSLIQIAVMWFIVQGIGAADKIWGAALDYMNEGGVLVMQSASATTIQDSIDQSTGYSVYQGAMVMLTGQVCMEALQRAITKQRQSYLDMKDQGLDGPCTNPTDSGLKTFCNNAVPNFIGSVNAVDIQAQHNSDPFTLPMPNLTDDYYKNLNGICGQISWSTITELEKTDGEDTQSMSLETSSGMTDAQKQTMLNSRAIAIQQMYENLSTIAIQMVNNDPHFPVSANSSTSTDNTTSASAIYQFGTGLSNGSACTSLSSDCTSWGASTDSSTAVLFTGNEFTNAIAVYDGVMGPTLQFIADSSNTNSDNLRDFIEGSESKGWLMAGSYYFNMIALAGSHVGFSSSTLDSESGLDASKYYTNSTDIARMPTTELKTLSACGGDPQHTLCQIFTATDGSTVDNTNFAYIYNLISGYNFLYLDSTASPPANETSLCDAVLGATTFSKNSGYVNNTTHDYTKSAECASTVFGFIGNSYFLYTPGEAVPTIFFANPGNISFSPASPSLPLPSCNQKVKLPLTNYHFCANFIQIAIADAFVGLYNYILKYIILAVTTVITSVLIQPLIEIGWPLLQYALDQLNNQTSNPIVNLGNMGIYLINTIMLIYGLQISGIVLSFFVNPVVGFIISVITLIALPLLASFYTLFISIGFVCAYYVPLLPYMIFTFGSISWFLAVVEAMVAAPILALGVMTPEGEGILGKSEQGIMILVNVFLRPSMMIVGFVVGSILTYVFVWVIAEGYNNAAEYLLLGNYDSTVNDANNNGGLAGLKMNAGTFSMIFGSVTYSIMFVYLYQTVVEKSFNLVYDLPDQVLRYMGGHPEQFGRESKEWAQGSKEKVQKLEEGGTGAAAASAAKVEKFASKLMNSSAAAGKATATAAKGGGGGGEGGGDGDVGGDAGGSGIPTSGG